MDDCARKVRIVIDASVNIQNSRLFQGYIINTCTNAGTVFFGQLGETIQHRSNEKFKQKQKQMLKKKKREERKRRW